ncbi:ABC transporter ATP-binding protein [Bacillus sp. M6-12]|uniref:ABC transporter ATP-binding protein n=1 Tax=Bacillus sp. M6-12 TaxID=2054166 RepID=UPI000C76AA8E|nr:ABC transporter ATP-binding protein [Bacillus sp. M6-12]PLS14590.1 ABC transporter ATP-binding protein [Bacillus sp. M6-12]
MNPLLKVEHLTKEFSGITAVKDVSFHVNTNEILGVIGPNGAGKTTLFNLITRTLPPTNGTVAFKGEDISTLKKPYQICKKGIVRTFQVVKPFMQISVLENVMIGGFLHHKKRTQAEEQAKFILNMVGLDHKSYSLASHLTLAEKKRLELARALSTKPSLLLLDEVLAGLNPTEIKESIPLIRNIRDSGVTIIMIEHIMSAMMNLADRLIVLHHGELISEGDPLKVTSDPLVMEAYFGGEVHVGS